MNYNPQPIDLICQHCMDGSLIPIKMRIRDEDGELQEYKIQGYRVIDNKAMYCFECSIIVRNMKQSIKILSSDGVLWMLMKDREDSLYK